MYYEVMSIVRSDLKRSETAGLLYRMGKILLDNHAVITNMYSLGLSPLPYRIKAATSYHYSGWFLSSLSLSLSSLSLSSFPSSLI